jgi:hypothetical protein
MIGFIIAAGATGTILLIWGVLSAADQIYTNHRRTRAARLRAEANERAYALAAFRHDQQVRASRFAPRPERPRRAYAFGDPAEQERLDAQARHTDAKERALRGDR